MGQGALRLNQDITPFRPVLFGLGEGLYQLRAALDGSIRGCAILETGQDPPPNENELEFPITFSAQSFKDSTWKIAPLSDYRRWMIPPHHA
jgi:hypothetical protein